MTAKQITTDMKWVTNTITQQNKTHREKQGRTPTTRKCTGCDSTKLLRLVYQVTSCQECATFMRSILETGIQVMECNARGAEHRIMSTPEHKFIDRNIRSHCIRHRFIQLLTKGFNTPHIENVAIGGNEHFHEEMRKALFIGSVKMAGEKYGFHQSQNSTSIDNITKELHLTEDCSDLTQMIGSLAQLQKEQPPPTPDKPTLVYQIQPRTPNHTNSTMLFYKGVTPKVIKKNKLTNSTHKSGKTISTGKIHGGGKPWGGKPQTIENLVKMYAIK